MKIREIIQPDSALDHPLIRFECANAGCSAWLTSHDGIIGHYEAADETSGGAILDHACNWLRARGAMRAIGPMNGSTWRRYRFITHRGPHPPFFLEPDNPDRYPQDWIAAGFEPLAHYTSANAENFQVNEARIAARLKEAQSRNIVIRPIRADHFEQELKSLHNLSLQAFADNYLYATISEPDFLALYTPIRDRLIPTLVQIAEAPAGPVGYIFATPDFAQAQRGQAIDTVVMKTIAVSPTLRGLGLGALLFDLAHQSAARLGFRHAIHALMHEKNISTHMSTHYANIMRRYTLFARKLK